MTTVAKVLALLVGLVFGFSGTAVAEKRVALVVGNSAYESTSLLKNAVKDAGALSEALRKLGFEVLEGHDLNDQSFRRMARDFTVKSEDADVALFFYAGHGLQVNGRNFLLPVNASLRREVDLEFETLPLELIMTHMERGERTNIVLLDACRNNPLAENLARSMGTRSTTVGRGLARVETGVGTYVGFSTQPGNVALDGEGENSPFAAALVKHIATPGLDIETLMRQVREEVISVTNGKQVPWGNSSLVGRGFVFKAAVEAAEAPEPKERAAPQAAITDQANIEIAYWNSIKDAGDAELLQAYLSEYPQGRFAKLARIKIELLTNRQAPPQTEAKVEPKAEPTPPPAAVADLEDKVERQIAVEAKEPAEAASKDANPEQKLAAVDPVELPAEPKAAPSETPHLGEVDAEEAGFFTAVKSSGDAKLIESYLKRYPKGKFVSEAKKLLSAIKAKQAAVAPDEAKSNDPAPKPVIREKPVKSPVVGKPKPVKQKKQAAVEKPAKEKKKKAVVPPGPAKKPVDVAVVAKPKQTPKPAREACGWCGAGGGSFAETHYCGAKYLELKARGRCGPRNQ